MFGFWFIWMETEDMVSGAGSVISMLRSSCCRKPCHAVEVTSGALLGKRALYFASSAENSGSGPPVVTLRVETGAKSFSTAYAGGADADAAADDADDPDSVEGGVVEAAPVGVAVVVVVDVVDVVAAGGVYVDDVVVVPVPDAEPEAADVCAYA